MGNELIEAYLNSASLIQQNIDGFNRFVDF